MYKKPEKYPDNPVYPSIAETSRGEFWAKNGVLICGSLIGIVSLFLGWITIKANRLAQGNLLGITDTLGPIVAVLTAVLWVVCLIISLTSSKQRDYIILGSLANLILITSMVFTSIKALEIVSVSNELIRVSLSSGILTTSIGAIIIIMTTRRFLKYSPLASNIITWAWLVAAIMLLSAGWFDSFSVMQEYFNNIQRFWQELIAHIYLSGISIFFGILIGFPLGIWAFRNASSKRIIFALTNITQTIPSLALFGLLIAPLSMLSNRFPFLQEIGIAGIGPAPAIIALTIYSLLPIVQNTFTGLHQINPSVTDAGTGMGMSHNQLLSRVELPLASPLVLEGIRTAAVQAIGNTAVAALIGAGGLGQFIFQGLGQAAPDLIILGAVPIIILALAADLMMQMIIRILSPKGMVKEAL